MPSSQNFRSVHRTRADLPRQNLEIPLEEPQEEEPEPEYMPPRRIPYTLSMFTHTPSGSSLSEANRQYLEDKVHMALENTQDWITSVEVRMTVDEHAHKRSDAPHADIKLKHRRPVQSDKYHQYSEDATAEEDRDMQGLDLLRVDRDRETKQRELAPFHIEVTVHMSKGAVVMSNAKHAQASLTEAADHMYDFLRRQMRKEKEKRVKEIRHAKQAASRNNIDIEEGTDPMRDIDEEEARKLDDESERIYAMVEPKIQEKED